MVAALVVRKKQLELLGNGRFGKDMNTNGNGTVSGISVFDLATFIISLIAHTRASSKTLALHI